ncbi:hypothetical protein IFM53868_04674 [Aspergillus udagawae]|uniref:Uncharacterized protein n=1 Tax=Aspergillus udagawae TaxID=91492 RepID=A0ABQ1AQ66_9EURO|nr:hypothetical protein IFM53868_04674 [Aspergillus udagawae]
MSLTSPKRSPQRGPVFPRRSRRLAGQTPEVDTWTAARARQRSVSMSRRQQSLNGMTEPSETFTNLVDAARARVESYVNGERPHEEYLRPCLKAFLEWLPPGGQTSVARNIVNAGNDDQKLWQVFQDLLACLLYPKSPIPSEPESPFNFSEPNLEVFAGMLIQPEVRDSDFRDECARRDDCRCCVTGHLDTTKWKQNGYLPDDEPHGDVECADIIPCNYTSWTGSEEELNVYDIKVYGRVSNILTMLLQPNERKAKFQCSEGAENTPLPDPTFLDCHYRVAEIINAADLAGPIGTKSETGGT